jgi:hypothetical protein
MAFSESSATMHFYATQLERLRKCAIPREMMWSKPTSCGTLNLQVITFQGTKHFDQECQYNFYGDKDGTNTAFFFRVGDGYPYRWSVIVHDRDELGFPVEWSLDTPSEWRDGFPKDVEAAMREIVETVFDYAKSTLGYQPEIADDEVSSFFDGIAAKVADARKNRR